MKLVNIVMAVYKPNANYFIKQLQSLNRQTYSEIKILFRDDSGDEATHIEITSMIKENIDKFEYDLFKNDCNLGSNKTFELLTESAKGEYIAYCDQDDIWENDKISKLVAKIEKDEAVLCYSDLCIIDEGDAMIAHTFKDINIRLKHNYGEDLFSYFLRRNSVTGCTMLIKTKIAKKAIPFCHDFYVHDHWLTLFASTQGRISYMNEPLVRYRIHENNQIGASMLVGINNKEDYLNIKLINEIRKYEFLLKNYEFTYEQREQIQYVKDWTKKRIRFFEKRDIKSTYFMILSLKNDWQLISFELAINFIPNQIGKIILKI